jgi:hypothetical protein
MDLETSKLWKENTMKIQNIIEELEIDLLKFIIAMRSSTTQCEVLSTMESIEYAIKDPHYAHVGCKATMLTTYACHLTQKTYSLIET